MRLRVLNSGSRANGYILYNDTQALVIECGVPYSKAIAAINFDRSRIVGALLSHEHGDHSKYVNQYLDEGIKVYGSKGTLEESGIQSMFQPGECKDMEQFNLGGFSILPFKTQHDSKEPLGFIISHRDMGSLLFATDTYYISYKFNGLSHIMIECNYDENILDRNVENGEVHPCVKNRVIRSHMSLATTISTLKEYSLKKVKKIVLVHLSSQNSDAEAFKSRVEEETGKTVIVAKKDLDINLDEI